MFWKTSQNSQINLRSSHPEVFRQIHRKNIFAGISSLIMLQAAEAATGGSLQEKVFLEISQNSQENTCARVSILIKLQPATLLKYRLWHRCFPVDFGKFLRTPFLQNTSWWVLLRLETWNYQAAAGDFQ